MEIDFSDIIKKIQHIITDVRRIREADKECRYKIMMDDLEVQLENLVEFININKAVFERYQGRLAGGGVGTPLDALCQNVLFHISILDNMLEPIVFINDENKAIYNKYNNPNLNAAIGRMSNINNKLNELKNTKIFDAFDILKHMEGHDKTLVILGPNGCGKTSLANYLKRVDSNVKVIPALKPLKSEGSIYNVYNATIDTYNTEIFGVHNGLKDDLMLKLIVGLCSENDDIAREYYNTDNKTESKFKRIKSLYDEFFDVQLDDSQFSSKQIMARKGTNAPFDFNNMSDGERAAFFYIATVIVAPEKSFIIVDEPENHLNPAIYNKIWDRLIRVRKDCQFIFISHTLEFIKARSNYEVVRIKNFVYPDKFEFEFLGEGVDELNSDYIVEIVGSRKPIIFCEGSKVGYDYKIYEILFGDEFTIIPVGTCTDVIKNVEVCNMHLVRYGLQKALGIIDSDLIGEEGRVVLRDKDIEVLKCNEIEMLLIDEMIFKQGLKQVFKDETMFSRYKNEFFKTLTTRKENIVRRLVKRQIDDKLQHTVVDDKNNKTMEDIRDSLTMIFKSIDVEQIWGISDEHISKIIADKDYDAALRCCCLEHNEILGGVCNKYVNDYANIALGVLKENKELALQIRERYLGDIHGKTGD